MRLTSIARAAWALAAAAGLGGCGFIPMSGPASIDVQSQSSATLPFAVVKLDSNAAHILQNYEPNDLPGIFFR